MEPTIKFAKDEDIEHVARILEQHSMEAYGDIDEFLVIKFENQVYGVAKVAQSGETSFHLETLAIDNERRSAGLGRLLLSKVTERPWLYCNPHSDKEPMIFRLTTVSRGEAADFYARFGFEACSFSMLDQEYQDQCDECPDKAVCQPVPMVLKSASQEIKN